MRELAGKGLLRLPELPRVCGEKFASLSLPRFRNFYHLTAATSSHMTITKCLKLVFVICFCLNMTVDVSCNFSFTAFDPTDYDTVRTV